MSIPRRASLSQTQNQTDLRHRVIACLNKLADRDTLAMASNELDSIARNLTHDAFSPFLNCLSTTDSSQKSPVRKQCVRLLAQLSAAHGDALSPHLSKMLSNILRRLRDPDSAVRSACVDAVAAMASQITRPPFSAFLKPLSEAILLEQDYNSQIGSSLCLAAAVEASPDPDPARLQKLLPRLSKLVKSDSFKAKPALLSLIGSIAGAGGASSPNVLKYLVPCLVEFLSSEDWAARKAAAEALACLAVAEKSLLPEFRSPCLASLENRRFDKVKIVRDSMNRSLELWREIPEPLHNDLPQSQSQSTPSPKGNSGGGCPLDVSKTSREEGFETPEAKKIISADKLLPLQTSFSTLKSRTSPPQGSDKKPSRAMFYERDCKKQSDWNVKIAVSQPPSLEMTAENDARKRYVGVADSGDGGNYRNLKPDIKRVLFNKTMDEKLHKFGGLRSGSRVVPFHESDNCEFDAADSIASEEVYESQKDDEDLSLIRNQLLQIQNQQFGLFDLLQRFIGSSQSGMSSLETRVNGLEKVLDEISCNLAASTGRVSTTDSAETSCCMLPGAEFLSQKFWRRTEVPHFSSRLSPSGRSQLLTTLHDIPDIDANTEMFKLESSKGQQHNCWGGAVLDSLPDSCRNPRGSLKSYSSTAPVKLSQESERLQMFNPGGIDVASFANCTATANLGSREIYKLYFNFYLDILCNRLA